MNQPPLAERMRPKSLDQYIGQTHILGKGKPLRMVIEKGIVPSMILWGPPGVGKTSLALLLAQEAKRQFFSLSAISSGVKDLREILGKPSGLFPPILFIDEIHRFNKSQQDSLLAAVEKGEVTLIGATTENPSFEINSALLSRCQVYVLEALGKKELEILIHEAIRNDFILNKLNINVESIESLLRYSGGDARRLFNVLELVVHTGEHLGEVVISDAAVELAIQQSFARYDKSGEQHYDIISAFIKSLRGSDPNAALYWLARMLVAGEDIRFIARRMVILAAEDIGLANPTALILANNCMDTVMKTGMPEARIVLSQVVIYLATSPKSNSAYLAIDAAMELAEKTHHLPVPLSLRNAPSKLMKEMGYGSGYQYSHNYIENFVIQQYLPDELKQCRIYEPGDNLREKEIKSRLKELWKDWYKY